MPDSRAQKIAATKLARKYGFDLTPAEPITAPTGDATYPGCELTPDEVEFGLAVHKYKRRTGRLNPTFAEVLAIAKSLGYRKVGADEPLIVEARQDGC